VHEMSAAVNGQIVTDDGDYDHRRLTTIYTDHDLPEHDASGQPAPLRAPCPLPKSTTLEHRCSGGRAPSAVRRVGTLEIWQRSP
jgi:hypothetical protein